MVFWNFILVAIVLLSSLCESMYPQQVGFAPMYQISPINPPVPYANGGVEGVINQPRQAYFQSMTPVVDSGYPSSLNIPIFQGYRPSYSMGNPADRMHSPLMSFNTFEGPLHLEIPPPPIRGRDFAPGFDDIRIPDPGEVYVPTAQLMSHSHHYVTYLRSGPSKTTVASPGNVSSSSVQTPIHSVVVSNPPVSSAAPSVVSIPPPVNSIVASNPLVASVASPVVSNPLVASAASSAMPISAPVASSEPLVAPAASSVMPIRIQSVVASKPLVALVPDVASTASKPMAASDASHVASAATSAVVLGPRVLPKSAFAPSVSQGTHKHSDDADDSEVSVHSSIVHAVTPDSMQVEHSEEEGPDEDGSDEDGSDEEGADEGGSDGDGSDDEGAEEADSEASDKHRSSSTTAKDSGIPTSTGQPLSVHSIPTGRHISRVRDSGIPTGVQTSQLNKHRQSASLVKQVVAPSSRSASLEKPSVHHVSSTGPNIIVNSRDVKHSDDSEEEESTYGDEHSSEDRTSQGSKVSVKDSEIRVPQRRSIKAGGSNVQFSRHALDNIRSEAIPKKSAAKADTPVASSSDSGDSNQSEDDSELFESAVEGPDEDNSERETTEGSDEQDYHDGSHGKSAGSENGKKIIVKVGTNLNVQ